MVDSPCRNEESKSRDMKGSAIQNKKGVRIDIQPRFKIQYPMKNQGKDTSKDSILQLLQ
jgi:hypothetical protein